MRVLIVDDSDVGRLMLSVGIDDLAECVEAVDGLEAVTCYIRALDENIPFSAVFMDVVMPNMDGKQTLRNIRAIEESRGLRPVPVYLVSASETLDGVEELATGLLRKPPSRQLLRQIIQDLAAIN